MNKYYGDIPEEDLQLVKELQELESWFDKYGDSVPLLIAAKGFTCIAHDFAYMSMEEEAERLLKRAEKLCPGYFKGPIYSEIRKDSDFAYLIQSFSAIPEFQLLIDLGFDYEQV